MSKDTYYFQHDYNARTDMKIRKVIAKHGYLGYGIFWAIIEDLYNNANALQLDYELIASDLKTKKHIVESIINDFDLFVISANTFYSNSVQQRLNDRAEKSFKAKESAKKRWENKDAMRSHTESNAIKEKKGKERKGNNIDDVLGSSSTQSSLFSIHQFEEVVEIGENEFTLLATRKTKRSVEQLQQFLKAFLIEQKAMTKIVWQNSTDAKSHFINWVNKQPLQTITGYTPQITN